LFDNEVVIDFCFKLTDRSLKSWTEVLTSFVRQTSGFKMKLPIVRSQRQLYRLWFEFLKLAKLEPDLQRDLRSSSDFYAAWGDVDQQPFDEWWKEHLHLFGQTQVSEIDRVVWAENVLHVAIPLNQPSSRSIEEVKNLIEDKQREKLVSMGVDPTTVKSLCAAFGRYSFTQGVEIRGRVLYDIQIMYGIWQELGKPAVNSDFTTEVVRRLRSRPRSKWTPYLLQIDPMPDKKGNLRYDEGQLRQVRRYLKKGYAVCKSVAQGEFPGRFTL
jgi:hypothetical protein